MITSLVPMPKPPILLVERAKEILTSIGHSAGADSAYSIVTANFLGYAVRQKLATREQLAKGNPAALHFWYRGSPTVMIPTGDRNQVTSDDPPMIVSGMSSVVIDPEGRLIRLAVVPPQVDASAVAAGPPTDWKILFDAAGLDISAFRRADPTWTSPHYADTRIAWTGPVPNLPDKELRIEAASYRGKPVYFQQVAPWTTAGRMPQAIAERTQLRWFSAIIQLVVLAMFISAALIARHNIKNSRGDRRGGVRLAAFISLAALGVWILDARHVADPRVEMTRFFIGQPVWATALLWLLYMALEPYVRRFWPATLVSWSRLMAGQWRDPLVGRDILFGVALGAMVCAVGFGAQYLVMTRGYAIGPQVPELRELLGIGTMSARILNQIFNSVLNALFAVFGMVLLKMFVKRERLAAGLAIGITMLVAVRGIFDGGAALINAPVALIIVTTIVLTIQKLGLVATMMLFFANFMMSSAVVTLDSSKWFFGNSLLLIGSPAALAFYGFYASRGGEPLLGKRVLD
jgi:hypothetical protein